MGQDKGLLTWNGKAFAALVADALAAVCDSVLLVGRENNPYPWLGLDHVPDRYPGLGPLAGLEAGLHTGTTPLYMLAACDQPLLVPELLHALLEQAQTVFAGPAQRCDALMPVARGLPQPLCAVYAKHAHPRIERCLQEGRLRLKEAILTERLALLNEDIVRALDPMLQSFVNINRPEEYERLLMERGGEDKR